MDGGSPCFQSQDATAREPYVDQRQRGNPRPIRRIDRASHAAGMVGVISTVQLAARVWRGEVHERSELGEEPLERASWRLGILPSQRLTAVI